MIKNFFHSLHYYAGKKRKYSQQAYETGKKMVTKVYAETERSQKNSRLYGFSTKEWYNSIYSYNKPFINSLVANNSFLNILLKSYLNMLKVKKTFIYRRRNDKSRYSAKKVYTSRAELEHTNSRVLITLYSYNKKKNG